MATHFLRFRLFADDLDWRPLLAAAVELADTSTKSVEEIAISILHDTGLMERIQR